jgi:hypothetical protein
MAISNTQVKLVEYIVLIPHLKPLIDGDAITEVYPMELADRRIDYFEA